MKRKLILAILISTLAINSLFSIGFGYHTFEVRTSPDFAKDIFPTSVLYQFDFPIPNFINGNTSEISFRIDNGLDFRTLRQHPVSGIPFAEDPANPDFIFPKDYMVMFDEMNLVFGQGFFRTGMSEKDTLKLWGTFDLRFERAFERLSYLRDSSNLEGLFQVTPRIDGNTPAKQRFNTWIGQPELANDRYTTNMSFSLGLDINFMSDKITRRNGIKNSTWVRLNPIWFDAFEDGTHDFLLFWNNLDIAWTPFHIKMNGERDTSWFSIVLDNNTTYRYIQGHKVPAYVQNGDIFGTKALNTEHLITNRSSITIYGPQINSYDCYPYISGFIDIGVSLGNLLNTNINKSYVDTVTSVGFKAEFMIFNVASIYYEVGYIIDNVLQAPDKQTIMRFGFTLGV